MAEVKETNIRTDVPAENQSVERCLTFESGDMTLFLSINNVTEIINDCAITHLPLVPDYIKGIINLRGQILPGSIVPTGKVIQSTKEEQKDLTVSVYAGADGSFTLYEDNGVTYDYEKGN